MDASAGRDETGDVAWGATWRSTHPPEDSRPWMTPRCSGGSSSSLHCARTGCRDRRTEEQEDIGTKRHKHRASPQGPPLTTINAHKLHFTISVKKLCTLNQLKSAFLYYKRTVQKLQGLCIYKDCVSTRTVYLQGLCRTAHCFTQIKYSRTITHNDITTNITVVYHIITMLLLCYYCIIMIMCSIITRSIAQRLTHNQAVHSRQITSNILYI